MIFRSTRRCRGHLADRARAAAGFTLIEVALAVAVVVIGLLALFALITAGLDASKRAVADTQAAFFADNVFSGLAAASQAQAERGVDRSGPTIQRVYWREFWQSFGGQRTNVTVAALPVWQDPPDKSPAPDPLRIIGYAGRPPNPITVKFQNIEQHGDMPNAILNHVLRYRLLVDPADAASGAWVSDAAWLRNPENTRIALTLWVWDGEFGSTDEDDAIVFYTEFDNPGDL